MFDPVTCAPVEAKNTFTYAFETPVQVAPASSLSQTRTARFDVGNERTKLVGLPVHAASASDAEVQTPKVPSDATTISFENRLNVEPHGGFTSKR